MLKDHYLQEDIDSVLFHIENLLKASTDVLTAAEKADPTIAKNAQFQIDHSLQAIMSYNAKKKKQEQYAMQNYTLYVRRGWAR